MSKRLQLDAVRKMVEDGRVDTVLVVFPDHLGRLIGKRVTGSYFLECTVESGMHACDYLLAVDMEMEPLPGMKMASWEKGYGDFHGVLDPGTYRILPWLENTAMVICDLYGSSGEPVEESPRAILRKQIERAREAGLCTKIGSELEFYLFPERQEELAARGFSELKPSSDYIIDYHILQTTRDEPVIREIRNQMCAADIPVEFSKGEWGRGQHEINLVYSDALDMADRHVVYKNGVKEIAWANGQAVTFMAKYDTATAGSSFHLHTSAYDIENGRNRFWDREEKKGSQLFRQFLGGLLRYSREFFLFFASTVNSYKRYQAGSFAPTRIAWAHDNRTVGFRVLGTGESYRIENRTPGADGNPYLAYAATIAAGLAGIEENLDCGEPHAGDAYQDEGLPSVPKSLREAVSEFQGSGCARNAFGELVVDHYARLGQLEADAFDSAVTDWERQRYFDRI